MLLFVSLLFVSAHFAQDATAVVGHKICREAPGPEDTLQFKLVLQQGGKVNGSGSFSGALGILYFSKGNWQIKNDRVLVEITLAGKMSTGQRMEKKQQVRKFDFPVRDLLTSKGCYEPQDIR